MPPAPLHLPLQITSVQWIDRGGKVYLFHLPLPPFLVQVRCEDIRLSLKRWARPAEDETGRD